MIKKRIFCGLLILPVIIFTSGCTAVTPKTADPGEQITATTLPDTESPEPTVPDDPALSTDPVAETLAAMTTEQKAAQLLVAGIEGTTAGEDAAYAIGRVQAGGIILFSRNVESAGQLTALVNGLKEQNGNYVPLFLALDEEGGSVSRMPSELADLPGAYAFGQIADPDARRAACDTLGQTLAAECRAFGINMDFAPVLDIWSNPENTVIGARAFGKTAETAADCGTRTAYGLMQGGVIPVGKHFPGHGDTRTDSHVGLPVVEKTVEQLWENELEPFRRAIADCSGAEGGPAAPIPAVMVGHIRMSALDPDRPASLSQDVVTGLLREQLGFTGLVVTDDLTMGAVSGTYGMGEAAVLAVQAGCDLLLVCHKSENLTAAYEGLLAAVADGRIPMERLDESVSRILRLKTAYGVTNDPVADADLSALNEQINAALP